MSETIIKAKTMHAAMVANISKGDQESDNIKGLTEVSSIIFSLITTIESQNEEIESLNWKIAHPVFCSGICKSQRDDYCGYHMSNEDCRACNSIWTTAHIENAVFSYKAITELAVNELKHQLGASSVFDGMEWTAKCITATLSEIERLQNGTT